MSLYLVGDIGGTNSRLQLFLTHSTHPHKDELLAERVYPSPQFPSMEAVIRTFLQDHNSASHRIHACCLAVAGPVSGNKVKLTNLPWGIDGEHMQRDLQIGHVAIINDFVGIGYGLLALQPSDYLVLQRGTRDPTGPMACIGAGTGLGEAYLTSSAHTQECENRADSYQVWSSEGGHTDFAARDDVEYEILKFFQETHPSIHHVSTERIVSGLGIPVIYGALARMYPHKVDPGIAAKLREHGVDASATISKAASSGACQLCVLAMDKFVDLYGAEAGNLALKLLPTGGMYICGGIAARIVPLMLKNDQFLRSFRDKGRMQAILERLPVYLVTHPQVGLLGAKVMAKRLLAQTPTKLQARPIQSKL